MTQQAPILGYENSLNRTGLAVERSEGFVRIITPRQGQWRSLSKGYFIAGGYIAFICICMIAIGINDRSGSRTPALFSAALYSLILAAMIGGASLRLTRQVMFEVARDTFTIRHVLFGKARRSWTYRRDAVRSIRKSVEPGCIACEIKGEDLFLVRVSETKALAAETANRINEAMDREPEEIDYSQPEGIIADGEIPARVRKAMLYGSLATIVIGTILSFFRLPYGLIVGLGLCGLGIVGLGISAGTQKKEFWQ